MVLGFNVKGLTYPQSVYYSTSPYGFFYIERALALPHHFWQEADDRWLASLYGLSYEKKTRPEGLDEEAAWGEYLHRVEAYLRRGVPVQTYFGWVPKKEAERKGDIVTPGGTHAFWWEGLSKENRPDTHSFVIMGLDLANGLSRVNLPAGGWNGLEKYTKQPLSGLKKRSEPLRKELKYVTVAYLPSDRAPLDDQAIGLRVRKRIVEKIEGKPGVYREDSHARFRYGIKAIQAFKADLNAPTFLRILDGRSKKQGIQPLEILVMMKLAVYQYAFMTSLAAEHLEGRRMISEWEWLNRLSIMYQDLYISTVKLVSTMRDAQGGKMAPETISPVLQEMKHTLGKIEGHFGDYLKQQGDPRDSSKRNAPQRVDAMTAESTRRRLSAIVHADVKGYSRLMGENEQDTVRTLTEYREIVAGIVQSHRGRVVDTAGDGFLLEFASVVDALECALEWQRTLGERNAALPANRKMEFRIGINVGDIIEQGERIFGDGVNIAARLEGLAEAGGICLSGSAYDQVKNKLNLSYQYIGEQAVKNIQDPVRAYRVLVGSTAAGSTVGATPIEKTKRKRGLIWIAVSIGAVALAVLTWKVYDSHLVAPTMPASNVSGSPTTQAVPDQLSIAILPFDNLSGDPEKDYLCDGLTEEIITTLAKIPALQVIARNSTFVFKGKPVNVRQVGQELGVRYVLEGSIRTAGERVRVTAQLIDARNGVHLWAERYDRELKDVLALQDEITDKIASSLRIKLVGGSDASSSAHPERHRNPEVYEKLVRASLLLRGEDRKDTMQARKLFEEAVSLDPQSSRAYAGLAKTYVIEAASGWSMNPRKSLEEAEDLAQKALQLNGAEDSANLILSRVYLAKRQFEKAIHAAERALKANPNSAEANASLGRVMVFAGNPQRGIELLSKAMRLNPGPPIWYSYVLGSAYLAINDYDQAIATYKKSLETSPHDAFLQFGLVAAYSLADRQQEARDAAAEFIKFHPDFSLERIARRMPYKNSADTDRIIKALRSAGLK